MIYVVNFQYKINPDVNVVINTTSRSDNWSRNLSPFFLGPVDLYGSYKSVNVENAWQYSKVYEYYLEEDGSVGERYFKWAQEGWNKTRADRYPMGKGITPLYSYWDGELLSYVEARKKIYIPLYSEAVKKTDAFKKLCDIYINCYFNAIEPLYLQDFDAHNLISKSGKPFDYEELFNNPNIKVGHAYVLAMLLENHIRGK